VITAAPQAHIDLPCSYMYSIFMKYIHFTWDTSKEQSNIVKHKIDFEEAKSVFFDPNALYMHDPDHSDEEERFVILGLSNKPRLLVVVHCYRENDEEIRIISARKADKEETELYGGD
jgi:uncharacterized DUF497 family protein